MFSKTVRGGVLALLIAALALAPAAAAQAAGHRPSRGEAKAVSARALEGLFALLWQGLSAVFEKEGASIDPSGTPGGSGTTGTSDEGASIDPSGVPNGG